MLSISKIGLRYVLTFTPYDRRRWSPHPGKLRNQNALAGELWYLGQNYLSYIVFVLVHPPSRDVMRVTPCKIRTAKLSHS